ncbi:hypothetical protein FQZ97_1082230 [compost metagenome]
MSCKSLLVTNGYALVVDLLGFAQGVDDLRGSRQAGRRLELVGQFGDLRLGFVGVSQAVVDTLAKLAACVDQCSVDLGGAGLQGFLLIG